MQPKASTWLWTFGVATVAGAISLSYKVKREAITRLNDLGLFKEAQADRIDALRQLPAVEAGDALKQAEHQTTELTLDAENEKGKWVDTAAVVNINERFREKKREIIRREGADNFSGQWSILEPKEKTKALTFSAINSIVAGGLTFAIAHAASKPRKGGASSDSSSSCGYGGGGHHGGHSCAGHSCGHGCAGCGGGH